MPVMATVVLEAIRRQGAPRRRQARFADAVDDVKLARRAEQRQIDVAVLLELHGHDLAYAHVAGVNTDDVGGEAHTRVFLQRDDRDRVGRLETRQPWMGVDREPHDRGAAGHGSR